MLSRRVVSGFAALAIAAAVHVGPAAAGALGEFNVLTFGDFTAPSSDVEGRLYAGGNVSLSNYSVGATLSGGLVGGDTLVVGGDLTFVSGSVNNGNAVVGGSAAGVDSSVRWGLINSGYTLTENVGAAGLPVDFTAEQVRLQTTSAALALLSATGVSEAKWSQVFLTGSGNATREVFNISAADLAGSTNLAISGVQAGAEIIVNVSGSSASWSGGLDSFFEQNRTNVIFNFFEAETLSLGSIGVQGSILAVNADISASWGVVWGQVVAESWNGPMQANNVSYGGTVPGFTPNPTTEVPAPAAAGMMIVGLFAFAGLRRRRAVKV